jgi:hypothetical protein
VIFLNASSNPRVADEVVTLAERNLGDELSSQEGRIPAYAHYAVGKQAVRMKVGPDTEPGE